MSKGTAAAAHLTGIELAKQVAAYRAVDKYVKQGDVVGVGSGSTVKYVVDRLAQREVAETLGLRCVPSSFQSRQLIVEARLQLTDLQRNPELDVCIDGADEVDPQLSLIKGGGGCQTQEKIVASAAKLFIVVADFRKQSKRLGSAWDKGVPVEIIPSALGLLQSRITKELGFEAKLRMATQKAGPVVTDNGGFILDVQTKGEIEDAAHLDSQLRSMPGVIETGLFVNMADHCYFGQENGSIIKWSKPESHSEKPESHSEKPPSLAETAAAKPSLSPPAVNPGYGKPDPTAPKSDVNPYLAGAGLEKPK